MKNVFITKRMLSFKYAFNGIQHLWKKEINFRIEVIISLIVLIGGLYFNITKTEWLLIIICIGIVIGAEAFNSAIECICDFVYTEENRKIKIIKDISAAAVLLVSAMAVIIGVIIFC